MPNGFIETGVPGIFGLPEPQEPGIGHTASCIQKCRFAYLAGTARGIQIVDLRDPANPKKAGQFVPRDHRPRDPRRAGGPQGPRLDRRRRRHRRLRRLEPAEAAHGHAHGRVDQELGAAGLPGPGPGLRDRRRGRDPDRPDPPQQPPLLEAPRRDHRGGLQPPDLQGRRLVPDLGDRRARSSPCSTCSRRSSTTSRRARAGRPVTGLCSAHYFDERNGLVAIGWYEEGTRFLDVRDPAGIRQVGYWVPTKGETWAAYFPPTDRTRRDRLRARLRARNRRAALRPRRPPRAARAGAALVAARGARLAGDGRRRAPAYRGRPTSGSSAGCRRGGTRRRRSRSCRGSGCRRFPCARRMTQPARPATAASSVASAGVGARTPPRAPGPCGPASRRGRPSPCTASRSRRPASCRRSCARRARPGSPRSPSSRT